MTDIIRTELLTKRFGDTTAVNQVSIHVKEAEIYGFLGLNGAGKTTLIRLLLGMIRSDSGMAALFNQPVRQDAPFWNEVGFLVEHPSAYPSLSVRENLDVFCRLRGLMDQQAVENVMDILKLGQYANKPARHLSMGNKQRLGLAKALLHKPRLLLLDEPINGLDPAGIVEIREFLLQLVREQGTTIFLSSHILSEISRLATRIGIVHEGRLIRELSAADLDQQIRKTLHVGCRNNDLAIETLAANGYSPKKQDNQSFIISDEAAIQNPDKIAEILVRANTAPTLLKVEEEDLEHYFLRIISESEGRQ